MGNTSRRTTSRRVALLAATVVAAVSACSSNGDESSNPPAQDPPSSPDVGAGAEHASWPGAVQWASSDVVVTHDFTEGERVLSGHSLSGEELWAKTLSSQENQQPWLWTAGEHLAVRGVLLSESDSLSESPAADAALLDPVSGEVVAADVGGAAAEGHESASERLENRSQDWHTSHDELSENPRTAGGGAVTAHPFSNPLAVIQHGEVTQITNMAADKSKTLVCEDGSSVASPIQWGPRQDGRYVVLGQNIVVDTQSLEFACFGRGDDKPAMVDDVSPGGLVALRVEPGADGLGGGQVVANMDGEVVWQPDEAPEGLGTQRFVDEDTLAISSTVQGTMRTEIQEVDVP